MADANGLQKLGTVLATAGLVGVIIWNQAAIQDKHATAIEARVAALEIQSRRGDMDHATHTATFLEVETQFKWLREVIEKTLEEHDRTLEKQSDWILAHDKEIAQRDAEQWERIKALERAEFGGP